MREISGEERAAAMAHAEKEAWNALARYKYWMFGYWAGEWVKLKNLGGEVLPSPFGELVKLARAKGFGPQAGSVESIEAVAHEGMFEPALLAFMHAPTLVRSPAEEAA